MRIAILGSRGIPAHHGGFETIAEELAVGLTDRGHEVTVFCEDAGGRHPHEHRGVKLRHVRSGGAGPLDAVFYDLSCLWRARRGFDVVYMLGYRSAAFCLLPRLFGTRVWINMDGLEWKRARWGRSARAWLHAMEGLALRVAHQVVFDSESVKRQVLARRGGQPSTTVIEYGAHVPEGEADPALLAEFDLEPDGYHLAICRFEPENRLREMIDAHAASGSARPLAVVADRRSGSDYARACRESAGDGVRFLGTVYEPNLLRSLRLGARSYVHGHTLGGTNPSLLEAMGAGRLCIAHSNSFNREVLGQEGLFFRNAAELAEMLREADAKTAEELAETGEKVRATIRTRYSWSSVVTRYEERLGAERSEPRSAPQAQPEPVPQPVPQPEERRKAS